MARITTYSIDSQIEANDKLIGSDAQDSNITKNYLISDLANFIGQGNTGAQGPVGPAGTQGEAGANGTSIKILGTVANCVGLPTSDNTIGDVYILDADDPGCSYGAGLAGDGYTWTAESTWLNVGPLRGPQGIQGPTGPQGIQGELASSDSLALVGLDLSWSNRDPLYAVNSTHIPNLVYSRLGVNFTNLTIEEESVYKLILERKRSASNRNGSFRKGGYKRSTGFGMNPPYSDRLSEIVFSETTGDKFDFRWDLFFQSSGFPRPAGSANTVASNPQSADVHFALRISKQTGNITEVSPVLTEFTLRGIFNPDQLGADKQKRLTFILK